MTTISAEVKKITEISPSVRETCHFELGLNG